jgi:hypothetical protein
MTDRPLTAFAEIGKIRSNEAHNDTISSQIRKHTEAILEEATMAAFGSIRR